MLKYSARVNYDVACPMHFEKYPVDIQRCNVSFESWGHTNHYIMLSWLYEKRKFSKSIALAQFGLDLHFIEEPPSAFGSLGKFFSYCFCYSQFKSPPFFVLWYSFNCLYLHILCQCTYTVWQKSWYDCSNTFFILNSKQNLISDAIAFDFHTIKLERAKGRLILKCLFVVFNFLQKTNENNSTWGFIVVE